MVETPASINNSTLRSLSKQEVKDYCWVAARLVREYFPESACRPESHPEIEILDQRFHIFHSFTADDGYWVSQRIGRDELLKENMSAENRSQYAIPSDDGLIFFLVGPEHSQDDVANVRVRWSSNNEGVVVISAEQADGPYRCKLQSSNDYAEGWLHVSLPLSRTFGSGRPPPAAAGCSEKAAWEICSHLRWMDREGKDWFMQARLEHHSPRRVAWPGWWLKPSTFRATAAKGYSASPPDVLARQALAAKGWMLASAEIMLDSGWARALSEAGVARVKLMGFESNNPLHDDHEGRGAHWHPTLKHIAVNGMKRARFTSTVDPVPHLYLDDKGCIDTAGSYDKKQKPAVNYDDGGIWRLEAFACFLNIGGSLSFCPLVALESNRAGAGFLHVRKSWRSKKDSGAQFQLLRGEAADSNRGSNWAVEFLGEVDAHGHRVVALRSAHCGGYLHVRRLALQMGSNDPDKWSVFTLYEDAKSVGSKWALEELAGGQCRLQNLRTQQFLHVRESFTNLEDMGSKEKVFQQSRNAQSPGSLWKMRLASSDLFSASILQHSYTVNLVDYKHSRYGGVCTMSVGRDASSWIEMAVETNTEVGFVSACVKSALHNSNSLMKLPLHMVFDPLTGCISGMQSRMLKVY